MKIILMNTTYGLIPCYDEDYEEKKRLKIGEYYTADFKLIRNPKFHRKYFALLGVAWEFVPEYQQNALYKNSRDKFRKTIQMAAGYSETIYNIETNSFIETPLSIAYEQLDNLEFETLYNSVLDTLYNTVFKNISEEDYKKHLTNF